jgi:hypothetical protein
VNPVILKLIVLGNGLVQPEFRDSVKVTVERPGVYFVEFKNAKSLICGCTATGAPGVVTCEDRFYAASKRYFFTQLMDKVSKQFAPASVGFTATCSVRK